MEGPYHVAIALISHYFAYIISHIKGAVFAKQFRRKKRLTFPMRLRFAILRSFVQNVVPFGRSSLQIRAGNWSLRVTI